MFGWSDFLQLLSPVGQTGGGTAGWFNNFLGFIARGAEPLLLIMLTVFWVICGFAVTAVVGGLLRGAMRTFECLRHYGPWEKPLVLLAGVVIGNVLLSICYAFRPQFWAPVALPDLMMMVGRVIAMLIGFLCGTGIAAYLVKRWGL